MGIHKGSLFGNDHTRKATLDVFPIATQTCNGEVQSLHDLVKSTEKPVLGVLESSTYSRADVVAPRGSGGAQVAKWT